MVIKCFIRGRWIDKYAATSCNAIIAWKRRNGMFEKCEIKWFTMNQFKRSR